MPFFQTPQSRRSMSGKPSTGGLEASHQKPQESEPVDMVEVIGASTCPACGHHVAVDFFDGGDQPLTTRVGPGSEAEAQAMERLPHKFVRCVDCGHIYNAKFDYAKAPCSDKPNLMYNRGPFGSEHLKAVKDRLLSWLPEAAIVVEISCGDGSLLNALAADFPGGRFIGFDPNAEIDGDGRIEAMAERFVPAKHLERYRPDLIISRHGLEHWFNPLSFIQQLAFAASWFNVPTSLFIEVPCVDNVLAAGRTVDFVYEHHSHFTTTSLRRMLSRNASSVQFAETSDDGEVVYALAQFAPRVEHVINAREASEFRQRTARGRRHLQREFHALAESEHSIVIWGGAEKAAAFINQNELDAERFPWVVDSDMNKVGAYVPGTGQEIRDPASLQAADIIVIATQGLAADIVLEIRRRGIEVGLILLEHQGHLVEYGSDDHPDAILELEQETLKETGNGSNTLRRDAQPAGNTPPPPAFLAKSFSRTSWPDPPA